MKENTNRGREKVSLHKRRCAASLYNFKCSSERLSFNKFAQLKKLNDSLEWQHLYVVVRV